MTDKIYDPFDDITELVMLDDEKLEKIYQAILKGCVYKVANDIYYLDRESKIEYIINDIAANEIDDYIKEKLLSLQKKMPEIVQDENIETKKNYTIELDHYVKIKSFSISLTNNPI